LRRLAALWQRFGSAWFDMLRAMNSAAHDPERTPSPPASYLFTLRIWIEQGDGERWRGRLEAVASGEVRHCRDWPQLVRHLRELLAGLTAAHSQ
jgi:hypothetical protein